MGDGIFLGLLNTYSAEEARQLYKEGVPMNVLTGELTTYDARTGQVTSKGINYLAGAYSYDASTPSGYVSGMIRLIIIGFQTIGLFFRAAFRAEFKRKIDTESHQYRYEHDEYYRLINDALDLELAWKPIPAVMKERIEYLQSIGPGDDAVPYDVWEKNRRYKERVAQLEAQGRGPNGLALCPRCNKEHYGKASTTCPDCTPKDFNETYRRAKEKLLAAEARERARKEKELQVEGELRELWKESCGPVGYLN